MNLTRSIRGHSVHTHDTKARTNITAPLLNRFLDRGIMMWRRWWFRQAERQCVRMISSKHHHHQQQKLQPAHSEVRVPIRRRTTVHIVIIFTPICCDVHLGFEFHGILFLARNSTSTTSTKVFNLFAVVPEEMMSMQMIVNVLWDCWCNVRLELFHCTKNQTHTDDNGNDSEGTKQNANSSSNNQILCKFVSVYIELCCAVLSLVAVWPSVFRSYDKYGKQRINYSHDWETESCAWAGFANNYRTCMITPKMSEWVCLCGVLQILRRMGIFF